jgi:aryl-alcohol dehydrogenase-like predicted oxidoreductase
VPGIDCSVCRIIKETGLKPVLFSIKVALRWLLQKDNVPSIVIGVNTLKQLTDNIGSLGWKLTHEEMEELDQVRAVQTLHNTDRERRGLPC